MKALLDNTQSEQRKQAAWRSLRTEASTLPGCPEEWLINTR
ncbi:hypothetical protein [Streptomyces sp. cmx-4-9]